MLQISNHKLYQAPTARDFSLQNNHNSASFKMQLIFSDKSEGKLRSPSLLDITMISLK